ncbi:hypothetical protein [Paenarthrobacter ureafaciens]|uniref:hypothetical protein n=1 Tax=Paenarthrobacter ureafaciens TaxID=37931 RepID=UPI0022715AA5|nr:hypothetical protein [Paenarthrobacter ureafaciens]MCY0975610.1 hypothetical protein [Paenarthrobacter ureafaciens]
MTTVISSLTRIIRSSRVYVGVCASAVSSLGTFAISISIARTVDIRELGTFAIAFSTYAFFIGLNRALVCEPMLTMNVSNKHLRRFARRGSLTGGASSLVTIASGLALSMDYLTIVGLTLHGLTIYDYMKTINLAALNKRPALLQETSWFITSIAIGLLIISGNVSAIAGFAIWAGSGAAIGYLIAFHHSLQLNPRWDKTEVHSRTAFAFGGDYVIGVGSAQITYNLTGVVAGLPVIGALRAGSTLLGPIGLIINSSRSLAIPFLARSLRAGRGKAQSDAVAGTIAIGTFVVPFFLVVVFLPNEIGEFFLGTNWPHAQPLLPFLALETAVTALTTIPFAGLRAMLAGRTTIVLRTAIAVVRVLVVVLAAKQAGALGAAISLAIVSIMGAIVWWTGYLLQLKKKAALEIKS